MTGVSTYIFKVICRRKTFLSMASRYQVHPSVTGPVPPPAHQPAQNLGQLTLLDSDFGPGHVLSRQDAAAAAAAAPRLRAGWVSIVPRLAAVAAALAVLCLTFGALNTSVATAVTVAIATLAFCWRACFTLAFCWLSVREVYGECGPRSAWGAFCCVAVCRWDMV